MGKDAPGRGLTRDEALQTDDPGLTSLTIRLATPEDYKPIVSLLPTREELFLVHPSGAHPFSVEQLQAIAEARRELTVVVVEGDVVGFANLYDVEPGDRAFIGNVVLHPTCRGRGIGRLLVEHMIRTGREKYRLEQTCISVFAYNTPALLLYSGLGFEPYAMEERGGPGGRRCALIHMKRVAGPN